MKATKEYISGIRTEEGALRMYKHTIEDGDLKGREFFQETFTPKIGFMEWGEPETSYYWDHEGEMYDSIKELLANP